MLNRSRLSILVHPNTRNPKQDHMFDPIWIGIKLIIYGEILPDYEDAEEALEPNTTPCLLA